MKFEIKTLVDVTETNARKGEDPLRTDQMANFNTLYNTIGLRTNPTNFVVSVEKINVKGLGFGSKHKGEHNVWTIEFDVEADESTNVDLMMNDFDMVPIISGLTETAKLEKDLFVTHSNHGNTNIIFKRIDK